VLVYLYCFSIFTVIFIMMRRGGGFILKLSCDNCNTMTVIQSTQSTFMCSYIHLILILQSIIFLILVISDINSKNSSSTLLKSKRSIASQSRLSDIIKKLKIQQESKLTNKPIDVERDNLKLVEENQELKSLLVNR